MNLGSEHGSAGPREGVPPTNKTLLVAAGVCLLIPIVALMWVSSYAKVSPRLDGVPFFFWYQFLWVILCSVLTWIAYRLVLAARPRRAAGSSDRTEGDA